MRLLLRQLRKVGGRLSPLRCASELHRVGSCARMESRRLRQAKAPSWRAHSPIRSNGPTHAARAETEEVISDRHSARSGAVTRARLMAVLCAPHSAQLARTRQLIEPLLAALGVLANARSWRRVPRLRDSVMRSTTGTPRKAPSVHQGSAPGPNGAGRSARPSDTRGPACREGRRGRRTPAARTDEALDERAIERAGAPEGSPPDARACSSSDRDRS